MKMLMKGDLKMRDFIVLVIIIAIQIICMMEIKDFIKIETSKKADWLLKHIIEREESEPIYGCHSGNLYDPNKTIFIGYGSDFKRKGDLK